MPCDPANELPSRTRYDQGRFAMASSSSTQLMSQDLITEASHERSTFASVNEIVRLMV